MGGGVFQPKLNKDFLVNSVIKMCTTNFYIALCCIEMLSESSVLHAGKKVVYNTVASIADKIHKSVGRLCNFFPVMLAIYVYIPNAKESL